MKRPIRIKKVIISSYDDLKNPYYAGGGAYAVHEVAKRLAQKYHVEVLTSSYPQAKDEKVNDVSYKRIGVPRFGPYLGQLIFQARLPFYARTLDYDLWIENFTPP